MRDDTEWLLDIIEAIERIERYASRGRDAFEKDELIQNWIVNHLCAAFMLFVVISSWYGY